MTREEAIKTIRRCCPKVGDSQCYFESALRELIPELAESEDERSRKWILEYLYDGLRKSDEQFKEQFKAAIDYLEKQKENIEKEYVFRPLAGTDITIAAEQAIRRVNEGDRLVLAFNGAYIPVRKGCNANKIVDIYDAFIEKQKEQTEELSIHLNGLMQEYVKAGEDEEEQEHRLKCYQLFWDALEDSEFFEQKEQKPAEWSKNDTVFLEEIIDFFENKTVKLQHDLDMYAHWLKSLSERFNLQPKQEWSEEDEKMLNRIIETLSLPPIYDTKACAKMVSWLKSLRPQSKAGLTLLDENIINATVAFVEQNDHFNCWGGIDKHMVINALRSLKPSWKPSKWKRYVWAVNLRFNYDGLVRYEDNGSYEIVTAGNKPKRQVSGEYILLKDISSADWKPSEEQMDALRVTLEYMPDTFKPRCTLMTLQNDLKKLM